MFEGLDKRNFLKKTLITQDPLYVIDFFKTLRYSDFIGIFFWGAISVLMCFIFFLFYKAKESVYFYYTLFLFFILVYSSTHLIYFPGINLKLLNLVRGNYALTEATVLTSFAFYVLFSTELLELSKQSKKAVRFLHIAAFAFFSYSFLYLVVFHFLSAFEPYLFIAVRIVLFSISSYTIVWIYKHHHSVVKSYFVIGSLSYLIGAIVACLKFLALPLPFHWIGDLTSTAYFQIGILIQALFFAMALGQRIVLLHEEKLAADQALIQQIQKSHRLSIETNKALETEVQHRVAELIKVKEELQEQESKRLKAEYKNALTQSEIRAKQAQVNPHFIYNSMNALKYMIQQEQNKKAIDYLVRFSRIVRSLLEKLEDNTIPLREEVAYIENYLKLEKERFQDFKYRIDIEEKLPIDQIPIPPLLLQPFVEYSIWEYLANKDKKSDKFRILIASKKDTIVIHMFNEGLENYSDKKYLEKEGIILAKERMDLFNQQAVDYQIKLCYNQTIAADNDCIEAKGIALMFLKKT